MTSKHSVGSLIIAVLVCAAPIPAFAQFPPTVTTTEVNLGPMPIDLYPNATNGTAFPSCPSSAWTIKQCIAYAFNNNPGNGLPYTPNNYVAQGVVGVRFQFALQSANFSSAWDSQGNVLPQWVQNLRALLADLHSYGISHVTVTPALADGWGGPLTTPNPPVYNCTGTTALMFQPWLPFGLVQDGGYIVPDCKDHNNGYSISQANPTFWGWAPLLNLVDQIFAAVNYSGLTLRELDLRNEVILKDFTVEGRLIYDNVTNTDVLATLRSHAASDGVNPSVITFSTFSYNPDWATYDCSNLYGDSAMLINESELIEAYAGGYSLIGMPVGFSIPHGLICGGSSATMIAMPVYHTQPSVTDVHAYPCVTSLGSVCDQNQDVTTLAENLYTDLYNFWFYRSLIGNVMMVGETHGAQNCQPYTAAMATQSMNGYENSWLYEYFPPANPYTVTVMRPWIPYLNESCAVTPGLINPPY
jgi:hypothetical protein